MDWKPVGRVLALLAVAVGLWALAKYGQAEPAVLGPDAPATQFSARRAHDMLARILGPQNPHPASTAENAAVRARIIAEFAKMGVTAKTYTGMGCNTSKWAAVLGCATVTDIIAPILPGPKNGDGKAIVLLAHYDSVPAGPGAADDGSGVASVLEASRALIARGGKPLHPVIALLSDGEEYGLLGADAFLNNSQLRDKVGAVINIEARGNQGPSRLFQTSPKASKIIDLYADHVPTYATSSLYAEIYKFLPNDTDVTVFLRYGIPSVNFAIADRVAHYHTALDTLDHLSLTSLQSQGNDALGMASALMNTPYADLKGRTDVYADVLGRWLPRMPESWALPLAIVLLLLIAGAVAINDGRRMHGGERARALVIFPLLLIGAGLLGWLYSIVAGLVSGMPDPSYAYPSAMRFALGFGVAASALAVSRLAGVRAAAGAVWLWLAVLGVAVAAFLPGFSPYFLLPLAVAAVAMMATARLGWATDIGQWALFVAALAALVMWMQLTASGETLMGLKLHPLFTIPAAIGVATLVPLLASDGIDRRIWQYSVVGCFAAGLIAAIAAGLEPAYSAIAPQRLNITYVADKASGKTEWAAETGAPLPASLDAAADFSKIPARPYPAARGLAYLAPAPRAQLAMPGAAVLANAKSGILRRVTLGLSGSSDAAMMLLVLPGDLGLKSVTLGERQLPIPAKWAGRKQIVIACESADCASAAVTLEMAATGAIKADLVERRAELPGFAETLLAARPKTAVPSQYGDGTMLVSPITVPAVK